MKPTLEVKMLAGEYWWGGSADDGVQMPFSAETKHSVFSTTALCC